MEPIPILTSVPSVREWRGRAFESNRAVGFVPTMGALHAGHLDLVQRSMKDNDLTVVSIFVNPAQFAPHEDLATYPRTFDSDLKALSELIPVAAPSKEGSPIAIFLPSAKDMYPSGIVQDVQQQKGTFIEVKGYSHQMEGRSRPAFFRGVATVVTKLFNVVQPTNAYFGQKDIQQALILRRLVSDLLMSHPSPDRLHIVPTYRCDDGLALSSRNAYLSVEERKVAPTLRAALLEAEAIWRSGKTKKECLQAASQIIEETEENCKPEGIDMRLDYLEMNDPETFDVLEDRAQTPVHSNVIISGALWVGKTRLIDNVLIGSVL